MRNAISCLIAAASLQLACASDPELDSDMMDTGSAGASGTSGASPAAGTGASGGTDSSGGSGGTGVASGGSGGTDATSPDAGVSADAGSDAALAPAAVSDKTTLDAFTCPGGTIGPGTNTLMVNGRARTLVADFPADSTRKMGILFSWHGYNQAEGQHRTASNLMPDANPDLPVVVITPDDVDFELPIGLDWQLDEGNVEKNVDLQFFEAMVGCLNEQYDIDPTHIHSLGYSAGSVMSALLHSVYPKVVNSIIAISGMWFNDQAEIDLILFAGLVLKPTWPELRPEDGGTILLTHGGVTDIAALIINLEAMAQAAFPFLAEGGRVVIDCPHNSGHTGHPDVGPLVISKFISENPSDVPSPYLTGGFAGYPSSCTLELP